MLDMEAGIRLVDAHVSLDESGDEHGPRTQARPHRLELEQPAAGVDDDAALAERLQRRRVGVTGDEHADLRRSALGERRRLANRPRYSLTPTSSWPESIDDRRSP
jgi:hypothetical protein